MQHTAAPVMGAFHLSPRTTETAEASFGQTAQLNNVAAMFENDCDRRLFSRCRAAKKSNRYRSVVAAGRPNEYFGARDIAALS